MGFRCDECSLFAQFSSGYYSPEKSPESKRPAYTRYTPPAKLYPTPQARERHANYSVTISPALAAECAPSNTRLAHFRLPPSRSYARIHSHSVHIATALGRKQRESRTKCESTRPHLTIAQTGISIRTMMLASTPVSTNQVQPCIELCLRCCALHCRTCRGAEW